MAPTKDHIKKMSGEWSQADQTKIVTTLYHKMFATHPEWQALFKKFSFPLRDDDAAFCKQVEVTRAMLDKAVKLAKDGDNDTLVKALHAMATRHVKYNVEQDKFQALKPILGDVLTDCAPNADRTAWMETLSFVIDNIVPA